MIRRLYRRLYRFVRFPSRETFIAAYCARSNVTWEWLRQYRECFECNCGDETCEGWQMVSRERCYCCGCILGKCVHDGCSECGGKRANA